MQILVNADRTIEGNEKFGRHIQSEVRDMFKRYTDQITRLEVFFSDQNGSKSGNADKRCLIEIHPAGHRPITASYDAATLEAAFNGAAKNLQQVLESTLGRTRKYKGDVSIRTENAFE